MAHPDGEHQLSFSPALRPGVRTGTVLEPAPRLFIEKTELSSFDSGEDDIFMQYVPSTACYHDTIAAIIVPFAGLAAAEYAFRFTGLHPLPMTGAEPAEATDEMRAEE